MEDSRWDFNKKDIIFHFRKKVKSESRSDGMKMFYLLFFYLFIGQIDKQAAGLRCRKLFENLNLDFYLELYWFRTPYNDATSEKAEMTTFI